MSLTPADLVAPPTWLVSITYAGRVFWWSSRPVTVTDADGVTHDIDGGLDPVELVEAMGGPGDEVDDVSIALDLVFPVDVAEMESLGHHLALSEVEVSILPDAAALEDRVVRLVGIVVDPEIGEDKEPVSLSVEAETAEARTTIPSSTKVVSQLTWGDTGTYETPEESEGLAYPIPFGSPGWLTRSPSTTTSGSPAIIVRRQISSGETHKLLVSGERFRATSVVLFYGDANTTATVAQDTDDLGQLCWTIDTSGAVQAVRDATEFFIGVNTADGTTQADHADESLEGAGSVCEWMLRRAGVRHDRGRWAAARMHLDRYLLAGYIDEAVDPVTWLRDNVWPILPISVVDGPQGLYPVIWRYDATSRDAVADLTEGDQITRRGRMRVDSSEIVNEIRLSYGLRARTGAYRKQLVIRGDADTAAGEWGSLRAEHSRRRLERPGIPGSGTRARELSTDVVYDAATAGRIVQWMIAARALPLRLIDYDAQVSEVGHLQRGDVVLLTDAGLSLSSRVALVQSMAWSGETTMGLTLLLIEQISRDPRT